MRFNHYTALFAAFCGSALSHSGTHMAESSSVDLSEPSSHLSQPSIFQPAGGDIIHAGTLQEIKWTSTSIDNGTVQVLLQNKESGDYTGFVELITNNVKGAAGHLRWKVNPNLPSSDKYYIRIAAVNDAADPNDSETFRIKASPNRTSTHSSSARVSSATTLVTGSTTTAASATATASTSTSSDPSASESSGAASATGTSTSTAGGSMATSFVSGPLALAGAVAVGMFAL